MRDGALLHAIVIIKMAENRPDYVDPNNNTIEMQLDKLETIFESGMLTFID